MKGIHSIIMLYTTYDFLLVHLMFSFCGFYMITKYSFPVIWTCIVAHLRCFCVHFSQRVTIVEFSPLLSLSGLAPSLRSSLKHDWCELSLSCRWGILCFSLLLKNKWQEKCAWLLDKWWVHLVYCNTYPSMLFVTYVWHGFSLDCCSIWVLADFWKVVIMLAFENP